MIDIISIMKNFHAGLALMFVTMLILFSALKAIGILRVSREEETAGLDVTEHGMHAYPG